MFSGWFKKSPLSSKGLNSVNSKNIQLNPIYDDDREILASSLIQGYKTQNTSVFNKVIPPLREYVKKNPKFAQTFLQTRFNRSQSDLSDVSQNDIEDMKHQLTRSNINGGRRKTRKYRKVGTRKNKKLAHKS